MVHKHGRLSSPTDECWSVYLQLLLVQVPPCTVNLAANITCDILESVFEAWPQLDRLAFYVSDSTPAAQNITAGRKLKASVSATLPIGDFLLSLYKARLPGHEQLHHSVMENPAEPDVNGISFYHFSNQFSAIRINGIC